MNSAAAQKLAGKIADKRRALFGFDDKGDPLLACMNDADGGDRAKTFQYYLAGSAREVLDSNLTFRDDLDITMRVAKSEANCNPTVGKVIRLLGIKPDGGDYLIRIAAVPPIQFGSEFKLICRNFV